MAYIKDKDQKILWGRAAGTCSICKAKLTQNNSSLNNVYTLGAMCHIVGENKGSARYDSKLSDEVKNSYSNLMLLCSHHHDIIDKNESKYTVEALQQIKADHETWVEQKNTFEYTKDSKVINQIFKEITILKELDYFIDQALYPYIIHSFLDEFDELERFVVSSFYHVYNTELKELIEKFYIAWSNVCKYWEAFTPTNVHDKLRPNTWLDIARTEDVQIAIKEVPKAAKIMHQELQNLLSYIRNTYKDIDL